MHRFWLAAVVGIIILFPVGASTQKGHSRDVITELPMPELFLQPVKYIAHTGTTIAYLRTEEQYCVDAQGQPVSPCLVLPYVHDPASTTWVDLDLATVVIPRKTFREAFSAVPRFGPSFALVNYTPEEHEGLFQARLVLTLDSPAFPGGPINTGFGDRVVRLSLGGGQTFSDTIHYTRHGIVGRQWLRDVGLSEVQVQAFFDNDLTVRTRLRVRGSLLAYGSVYVGVLIQGY